MANQSADLVNIPPMGGLALMAMNLALDRANSSAPWWVETPPDRFCKCGPCQHYFPIIDCIAYGHVWRAEKEFASCVRCHNVKAMRDFKPGEYEHGR